MPSRSVNRCCVCQNPDDERPAAVDSSADSAEICRRVAPTSRSAVNRCSPRAADSLVAVPMKISTGPAAPGRSPTG